MKIIEKQRLYLEDVRSMCIRDRLYTCGTVEEYDRMFGMVKALRGKDIITAQDLYPIADDILRHSNTEQDVASIMWGLGENIHRHYEVEEE